jgi:hypothetical protein
MAPLRLPAFFLRTGYIVSLTIILAIYLPVVLFTDYSLTGFWTDVIFSLLLSTAIPLLLFLKKITSLWLKIMRWALTITITSVVFVLTAIVLSNPFIIDHLKLRSFCFQKVEGRIFHAYFKPAGSYSGGYGNFWITESPVYFPLIEKLVYYDRTVHHDFRSDEWEGEPIDNYEVVRAYIKDEVIDKGL